MNLGNKNALKHGMTRTYTHRSWQAMRARCLWKPPLHSSPRKQVIFALYSKLGICERWMVFANFLADMGERPAGATLDRIDNEKGYEPGNCRWATNSQQQRNKRTTKILEFGGKMQSLPEWADEIGVRRDILTHRLRLGWSVERTLTTPVGK